MKKQNITRIACMAACAVLPLVASAATRTWTQGASGEFSWSTPGNWQNSTLPTSSDTARIGNSSSGGYVVPGGHQTITGDSEVSCLDVITAYPVASSAVRTFTGNLTAARTILRTGTNEFSGTLTLTAKSAADNYSIVGTSNTKGAIVCSVLDIVSGGEVIATNAHAIYVGRHVDSDNNPASGRVRLRDGGRLLLANEAVTSAAGLRLGALSGASTAPWFVTSYIQDGGYAQIGYFLAGGETGANASFTVAGGVLDLKYVNGSTRFQVGKKGYGTFQQLGGEVYVNTNHVLSTLYLAQPYAFQVGSGLSAADGLTNASFYACGGTFVNGSAFVIQGPETNMTGVLPASATIAGTAVVTSKTVRVGANTGDGLAVLNLNGGLLSTAYLRGYDGGGRLGASEINADGGTVSFPDDGITVINQFVYIDRIRIYSGGLTVDCGRDITIGLPGVVAKLCSPSGLGLKSLTRSYLNNCVYVPRIEISGGSGSNATATALIDYNSHRMTNIVITCRGEGYKADDVLTVKINRASVSVAANLDVDETTKVLEDNERGALVKTGAGSLSLYAQPEFDGTYEVRQGRMIQTTVTNGSEKVSAIVVGGTDAVFQCGTANSTATVAKSNPVNTNATLTLGTAYGPGTLAVPAAANGQSAAFEQTFASLTVSGKGNTIEMASGNTAANGAKVTFGNIICPDGAEVTIPHWTSSFKVYVTGRPARTVFKNVLFAGTDLHAAVGPDGQLIPAPGTTVLLR